jgi:hypothetical protein
MYVLIINRVAGLTTTTITSDDIEFLRNIVNDSKNEMYTTWAFAGEDKPEEKPAVVQARIFAVSHLMEEWKPEYEKSSS